MTELEKQTTQDLKDIESGTPEAPSDQTRFGADEPFFEEPPWLIPDKPIPTGDETAVAKKPKKLFIVIGLGVLLFVILLLLAVWASMSRQVGTTPPETEQIIEASPSTTTPLNQKIQSLKTELKAADPAARDNPFPPLDMGIRLDPKLQGQ